MRGIQGRVDRGELVARLLPPSLLACVVLRLLPALLDLSIAFCLLSTLLEFELPLLVASANGRRGGGHGVSHLLAIPP